MKQKLTVWTIDLLYWVLKLIFFKTHCELDRAWLLRTFKGSKCKPVHCDTPEKTILEMIAEAKDHVARMKAKPSLLNILEPSFGTGVMLKLIDANFRRAQIYGVELSSRLFAQVQIDYRKHGAFQNNFVKMLNNDFLKFHEGGRGFFHVIIMNPPYSFKEFIKHIRHALYLLDSKGVLVTLVPESFLDSISPSCISLRGLLNNHYDVSSFKMGQCVCNYPVSVYMLKITNKPDSRDDRGNKERAFVKEVTTNAPTEFILNIPIFKGFPNSKFRVEVCLDVTEGSARFWFESIELHEIILKQVDEIFAQELKSCEDFVIVNK